MNENSKPIIVALDFPELDSALALVDQLDPSRCRVKVGKELFTRAGPQSVTVLTERGFDVFLDLKFHDIPNTVAAASRAVSDLGCWMFNVHASGGGPMMEAAAAALPDTPDRPLLIAVTVLTSMDAGTLAKVGQDPDPTQQVLRLARLGEASGLDGVVCSPLELGSLRKNCAENFAFVTPGVRPAGAASNDQRRVATPAVALAAGATYLVIGRPITQAADPMQALAAIDRECGVSASKPQA